MASRVKRHAPGLVLGVLALLGLTPRPLPAATTGGDRRIPVEILYPPDAFVAAGGRILDVTKPPFNARGDGKTDDTRALIAAVDFVADRLRNVPWTRNPASHILYLPKGTYLVSDTIVHSGPVIKCLADGWDGMFRLRIIGQSREETVIRLRDACPGFERGGKPVLSFQKGPGTNVPGLNQCRNLTVDIGRGNPGATGILFMGANTCSMNDVTIRSSDGRGAAGLDLALFSVQGHLKDITVEGFDYGVRVTPMEECNPALEHLTLRGQGRAGVLVERGSPCLRDLWSANAAPAVLVTGRAAHVVLVDSVLDRGAEGAAAVDLRDETAQLFARNVRTAGYGVAVSRKGGAALPGGWVEEYVSGGVFALHEGQARRSLNLPVEDAPVLPRERDLALWANPDRFPGATDAEKVQRAMDSGATTVYFPRESYDLRAPVRIPPAVRHIDFLYCNVNPEASFVVDRPSPAPLWVEHKNGYSRFRLKAPRTLVMHHCGGGYEIEHADPTKAFLESCVNITAGTGLVRPGQSVWARSINNEYKHTSNFKVDGGALWVLGFKTEGAQPCFEVTNGGVLEALGGYRNETEPDRGFPMVINRDSHVALVAYTSMAAVYEQAVEETWKGATSRLSRKDLPPRLGYKDDFYIPLYVGYGVAPRPVVAQAAGIGTGPKAAPPAASPPPQVPAEVLAAWDARLRERAAAALQKGRAPTFRFARVPDQDSTLAVCDGAGPLKVRSGVSEMDVPWSMLSLEDKRGLAVALAEPGEAEDLALAAFYQLLSGRRADGERLLGRAGAAGEAVRAALGLPKP